MNKPYVLSTFKNVSEKVPWLQLIEKPTPVYRMVSLGNIWNHQGLYIKREDETNDQYGGNKIRNLEFILGDVLKSGKQRLVTLGPYGSNFSAALAAHANKFNLNLHISQFVTSQFFQMEAHAEYCLSARASARNFFGILGLIRASLDAHSVLKSGAPTNQLPYWVVPGGSNSLGALGHLNAIFELNHQILKRDIPEPDYILVGVGTGGTIAGLIAGIKVLGLKTKVIGVRCASSLVCNKLRICYLVNEVLKKLDVVKNVSFRDFELLESPSDRGYGIPAADFGRISEKFKRVEGVTLDSTYTSKVILFFGECASPGLVCKQGSALLAYI